MSKKNKKKDINIYITKKNIKSLKKGYFKIGDDKILLDEGIKECVKNTIVSNLDSMIDNSTISDTVTDTSLKISTTSQYTAAINQALKNPMVKPTIIIYDNFKNINDMFDYLAPTTLGRLLRTSTLPAVYSMIKEQWLELVSKRKEDEFDLIYVPNVRVFINDRTGENIKSNIFINVLVVVGIHNKTTKKEIKSITTINDAHDECDQLTSIKDTTTYKVNCNS